MNFVIIGYGARGHLYSQIIKELGEGVCAVCDPDQNRLALAKKFIGLSDDALYHDTAEMLSKGRLGEICIVATQDGSHREHAVAAMNAGYDLLLEKPIARGMEELFDIYLTAKKLNKKVFICHVLRYAPFFNIIKEELGSGLYGGISTINLTENVAYWHQAHSFVRGNWANSEDSTPMIIAKCCHDLDLLAWYAGKNCVSVSSYGSLNYFTNKNAPQGSAERCLDCAVKNDCPYDAERLYIFDRFDKGLSAWPVDVLVTEPTREKLYAALREGKYGKCVFRCNNNAVDHQVVNMLFEGGPTAHLTMTAFSKDCYRNIHIHCEKGEIYGSGRDNILHCNIFGKTSKQIDTVIEHSGAYGHGGGDYYLIKDIISSYRGRGGKNLTSIGNSMLSHFMGFAAEQSRLSDGKAVECYKFEEK